MTEVLSSLFQGEQARTVELNYDWRLCWLLESGLDTQDATTLTAASMRKPRRVKVGTLDLNESGTRGGFFGAIGNPIERTNAFY
jgi:hypothetical protein